jgi:hypothetical protein
VSLVIVHMLTIEETLSSFLFLFLKHLSFALSNLAIIRNHQRSPKRSILRSSNDDRLAMNQNRSFHVRSASLLTRRHVSFTHIDSYRFDPRIPCRFLGRPQRQSFVKLNDDRRRTHRLCHRPSKRSLITHRTLKSTSTMKLKRWQIHRRTNEWNVIVCYGLDKTSNMNNVVLD